jgi:serine/threonine protein phosphatase 1
MLRWFRDSSRPTLPDGQRVYAIGDVHGRLDLLDELLATIASDNAEREPAQVSLIFLGDLIDRGPDSRGVVARVRAGVDWARTISIMGNHEAVMLDALDGQIDTLADWLRFGGRETLLSWGITANTMDCGTLEEILHAARDVIAVEERAWLGRMRSHVRMGDYYFVHAGIRPGVALDKQDDEDRFWIRDEFLESRKSHGAIIVHGHSIKTEVEQRTNRIGLDTGAYATGRLTAAGLQSSDRWFLTANQTA